MKDKYANKEQLDKIKKVVNGHVVMKLRNLTPSDGVKIGKVIKDTISWILDNGIDIDDQEAIQDHIMGIEI